MSIRLVATDLDGTLMRSNGEFSVEDIGTLCRLGKLGVVRVIATGRSPYSASRVLSPDFPIDYLVFSSGAGILKWDTKTLVHTNEMPAALVQTIISWLCFHGIDFMVHNPIPLNHYFQYFTAGNSNPDFERRLNLYKEFATPLIQGVPYPNPASQVVAILPNDEGMFNSLRSGVEGVKIIRATSPIDGSSIWMEIFPETVSKASGIRCICQNLEGVTPDQIVVVGNDYNDSDMLQLTAHSFVVENAPELLKKSYTVVPSNDSSGFSYAINKVLGM
ncbi:MAG TPA: HAD family hydrolase [Tenuifilaceae bacterium]|nr:HAD family hydrolase [Tenuifilaceae bacterium]